MLFSKDDKDNSVVIYSEHMKFIFISNIVKYCEKCLFKHYIAILSRGNRYALVTEFFASYTI